MIGFPLCAVERKYVVSHAGDCQIHWNIDAITSADLENESFLNFGFYFISSRLKSIRPQKYVVRSIVFSYFSCNIHFTLKRLTKQIIK